MKRIVLNFFTIAVVAILFTVAACNKDEDNPKLSGASIDGAVVTVNFSEAAYGSATSADLVKIDGTHLSVSLSGGSATLIEYEVEHEAGATQATVSLVIDGTANGSEVVRISIAANSVYTAAGTAFEASEVSVTLAQTQATEFTQGTDAAGNTATIINDHGAGIGNYTMEDGQIYILDGFVWVNSGQTLTIKAGAIIKGKTGEGENASCLAIAMGGKVEAAGTATKPIIMTSENDPVKWESGALVKQTDLDPKLSGQWGGLIVLGKGVLNTVPATQRIEGIPLTEGRGRFGGSDNNDNSGTLTYISVRHGGSLIGADNEINGISFAGVGAGTTIHHLEVFGNLDDGFEFWGGTASYKYLLAAFNKDDSFDYDAGFNGKCQFWAAIQSADSGDHLGELDGADKPEEGTPYATPTIYNATFFGAGANGDHTLEFKANAGGYWYNSIFVQQKGGVRIQLRTVEQDSYKRLQEGQLKVEGNMFFDIAGATTLEDAKTKIFTIKADEGVSEAIKTEAETTLQNYVQGLIDDGKIYVAASTTTMNRLNPIPAPQTFSGMVNYTDGFDAVTYKGAFDPNATPWYEGWTLFDAALKAGLISK